MSRVNLIDVTPVLTTDAYTANDMLFVPIEVPLAIPAGKSAKLVSLCVIDKDDQEKALDILFFESAATTEDVNDAEGTDDANNNKLLTIVTIITDDYVDLASGQVATQKESDPGMGAVLRPNDKEQASFWLAGVTRSTPTHTASGLLIRIGLEIT